MESESVHGRTDRTNPVLVSLSSRRRRVTLAALETASSAVSVPDLATRVAAALHDTSADDVGDDERQREHVALVHRELPKLDEADLVDWDRDDATVSTTDHPALADPNVRHVIDSPGGEWDDILECLAHDRRRAALSVLVDHGDAIARRNLARETVARERNAPKRTISSNDVDEALSSLHHVHLPKLREAGLLVDDDLETVRYDDHPDLDEKSLAVDAGPNPAATVLATQ